MTNLHLESYDLIRILGIIHTKGHIYLPGNKFLIPPHSFNISAPEILLHISQIQSAESEVTEYIVTLRII